jgi:phage baseplate assembly protein W
MATKNVGQELVGYNPKQGETISAYKDKLADAINTILATAGNIPAPAQYEGAQAQQLLHAQDWTVQQAIEKIVTASMWGTKVLHESTLQK